MQVRLTRKLAESLNGVDLSRSEVGEIIEVTRHEAELLIAEGWAETVTTRPTFITFNRETRRTSHAPVGVIQSDADPTTSLARTAERLREVRKQLEQRFLGEQQRRRAEDRIREELHDSRAKTA